MDILSRDIWERKYIDLWTVVHILTGMCFGFAMFFYNSPFKASLVAFVVFTILWEVLEFYTNAREPLTNQIMDVLTGIAGFLATYTIIPFLAPNLIHQVIYFTIVYSAAWTFAYFGFQSFALHFNRDMEKYKNSFSLAAVLYVIILITIFLF